LKYTLLFQNKELIRKFILTGFFHLINALTTVLILLFIGQLTSSGDSTKSKIIKLIFFDSVSAHTEWIWMISLLIIKISSSFAKSKLVHQTQYHIQSHLQQYCLNNLNNIPHSPQLGKEIKNLSRAIIKGQIIVIADFVMLFLIFIVLLNLNGPIALAWLLFFLLGIALRWVMAQYYTQAKRNFRNVQSRWMVKFAYILQNANLLVLDSQIKKEKNIFERRTETMSLASQTFSRNKAWTAAFMPAYFYSFLLIVVYFLHASPSENSNSLQLVLVLIYSQSSLIRSFKSPEHWKLSQHITDRWKKKVSRNTPAQKTVAHLAASISHQGGEFTATSDWKEIVQMKANADGYDLHEIEKVARHVYILIPTQTCTNESYLASVITTKEAAGLKLISSILQQLDLENEWAHFSWKSAPMGYPVNQDQLKWLNVIKSISHPGNIIVTELDHWNIFSESEKSKIEFLIKSYNKKLIVT
jgi:ABC-type multidrug transport system fused ATPase/permease subunit